MKATGTSRAALFSYCEGASMSALFSATYPERVSHLLLYGGFARFSNSEGYDLMSSMDHTEKLRILGYRCLGAGVTFSHRAPRRSLRNSVSFNTSPGFLRLPAPEMAVNWRTIPTNRRSNTRFRSNQSVTALSPKYRMTAAFPAKEPCMDRYDFLVLASVASFFALSIAAIWLFVWG